MSSKKEYTLPKATWSAFLVDKITTAAAISVVTVIRLLGIRLASWFFGSLMQLIGKIIRTSRTADKNLQMAMPELGADDRKKIISKVWNNLGRTIAELPHIPNLSRTDSGPGWEIVGEEVLNDIKKNSRKVIYFSAHFSNWELMLPIAAKISLPMSGFYRAASNPSIDRIIQQLRDDAAHGGIPYFPKGTTGVRAGLAHLQKGGSLGFLMDQKMNDGIPVPFFGKDAMTAPALAQLSLRYDLPIIPVHIERLGQGRFRMVVEQPISITPTGSTQDDVVTIMTKVNETIERWVRADPGSWLWLHRRWPNV